MGRCGLETKAECHACNDSLFGRSVFKGFAGTPTLRAQGVDISSTTHLLRPPWLAEHRGIAAHQNSGQAHRATLHRFLLIFILGPRILGV